MSRKSTNDLLGWVVEKSGISREPLRHPLVPKEQVTADTSLSYLMLWETSLNPAAGCGVQLQFGCQWDDSYNSREVKEC